MSKELLLSSTKSRHIDWAGLIWLFLFFWFFSGLTQALIWWFDITDPGPGGLRRSFLLSGFWLIPVLLFPRRTRQIAAIIGVLLWITSLINLGYFGIFLHEFSSSIVLVIFETNLMEAQEFLIQFLTLKLALGLILYSGTVLFLWRRVRPIYLPRHYLIFSVCLILVAFSSPVWRKIDAKMNFSTAISVAYPRMEAAVPWQFVMCYIQYRQQLDAMQQIIQKYDNLPGFQQLKDVNGETPRTLVMVIGESTSRSRMSLYGYARKTTPHLDALRDEKKLIVFNDVIATRPDTILSLQQVFTFADQEHPDRFLTNPTLINLMKQAGYKTFWITNQQTIVKDWNTWLTTFSQQMDKRYYLNNRKKDGKGQYDEVVFSPFSEVLQDPAHKKFIVVHLMGSHTAFASRYPETYEKFTTREGTSPGLSQEQVNTYNRYDNSVLYNDFVVSRLIEIFSQHQDKGFLLYFSDHGEEVFDTPPYQKLGRDDARPTRNMLMIPFILWFSPGWQKNHSFDFSAAVDRKYSLDRLIHTWSDLAGLSYDRFMPEQSLVNPIFREMPRWVGEPGNKAQFRKFDTIPD
jgi:heptose-I-phosphate ethanolaminephosphotransferase